MIKSNWLALFTFGGMLGVSLTLFTVSARQFIAVREHHEAIYHISGHLRAFCMETRTAREIAHYTP